MLVGEREVFTDTTRITAAGFTQTVIPQDLHSFCTHVIPVDLGPVLIDDKQRRHILTRILAHDIIHLVEDVPVKSSIYVAQYHVERESGRYTIERLPQTIDDVRFKITATLDTEGLPYISTSSGSISSLHSQPQQEVILSQDEIDALYEMLPQIGFLCALGEGGQNCLTNFFQDKQFSMREYVGNNPREHGVTFYGHDKSSLSLSIINRMVGKEVMLDVIVEGTDTLSLEQANAANELYDHMVNM